MKHLDGEKVFGLWKCYECGRKDFKVTFRDVAEVGTPMCPDCDTDCIFTGNVIVED